MQIISRAAVMMVAFRTVRLNSAADAQALHDSAGSRSSMPKDGVAEPTVADA